MGEFTKQQQIIASQDALELGAPLSAFAVEKMLNVEQDSPLFKEKIAALAHLAALEEARELEFFIQSMDKVIQRKLEEEAAAFSAYYTSKRKEETNRLIDADNKKQQEHPKTETTSSQVSTHFIQLALAVITHHINQWVQAQQNIQAAQAARAVAQNQWQTAQQTFVNNVVNTLTNLGTVNPALAGLGFAANSPQIQLVQQELGRRQLPMQVIQRLPHVHEALQNEEVRQRELIEKECIKDNVQMSELEKRILAKKRGRDNMNGLTQAHAIDRIPLMKILAENQPLVKKLMDLKIEKTQDALEKIMGNERLKRIFENKVKNEFIDLLRGDRDAEIRDLDDKCIECDESEKYNNEKMIEAQSNLETKFNGFEQLTKHAAFLDFIKDLKAKHLVKEESINKIFGLKS